MSARLRILVAIAGVVFVAAHLRALPRTLEDIDSVNFALGVEAFDVASHRPHPPGYPVFIAMSKVSTAAVHALRPSWDRDRTAAAGLAIWGVIAGGLATWLIAALWIAIGLGEPLAFLAAVLAVVSPLFWFSASRPLTDVPGLVAAIGVQVLLVKGLRALREDRSAPLPRVWLAGACVAGLIIGLRSQTAWFTGPLLVWCAGELLFRGRAADAAKLVALAAIGALAWAIPLVWMSGGVGRYLFYLRDQGQQDFTGIEMIARIPSWHLFQLAMRRTFVDPWPVKWLANGVLGLGVLGLVRLAWSGRRVLAAMLLCFWTYLVFHVVFQETVTLRYSLPLVIPVCALAVIAVAAIHRHAATLLVAALSAACLVIAQPPLRAYAAGGAPVFRAFQEMLKTLPTAREQPLLKMHHQVYWGILRALVWYQPLWDVGPQVHPGKREWLGVVTHFENGGTQPVWFLSDVNRTDLSLFDPRSRTLEGSFEEPPSVRAYIMGTRLDSLRWWTIDPPGWMLGTGWSLTPESRGVTTEDATGPHQQPAVAWLRARQEPVRVMIGGRYIGPGQTPTTLIADLEGAEAGRWTLGPSRPWFVEWIDWPRGVVSTTGRPYARLTARAVPASPTNAPPGVLLEQFDAAPVASVMFAFQDGWHELENNPATGEIWRWVSNRGTIEVRGAGKDLTLTLAGPSPLKNFDHAPDVVVRAGQKELARFLPDADFTQTIPVPLDALTASSGLITIETNLSFVPAERGQGADQRRLGVKFYRIEIR